MLRAATILLCLSASATAAAQVYKCVSDGKVAYSDSPCPGAKVTRLALPAAPPGAPVPADPKAELQRQKALADQLSKARKAGEAQHETQRARIARAAAQRYQRCEKLRLQKKWAEEDARGVRDGDLERTMRKKADRAAESLKVECPG